MNVLENFYGEDLESSVLLKYYYKHINTIKNHYKEKNEARFTEYRRIIIRKLEEYIDRISAKTAVSKQLPMIDKSDLLDSSDYKSLYCSATAHPGSKWPKTETAKAIYIEDTDSLCSLFNNGDWKCLNTSEFYKVRFYNPKDIIFQHRSVKEIIFNDRINR